MQGRPLTVVELEQWVGAGAAWRARELTDERAVIELRRCTGELEELRETRDPVTIEYVRTHRPDAD